MSLQTIALESARATLPGEFARIGGTSASELAAYAGGDGDDALVETFAAKFLPPLLSPINAQPKLTDDTPPAEARALADLYWRCAVAMHMMPLPSLSALVMHHADLRAHLARNEAPEAERRASLVYAMLPRFAQVCTTAEDRENAARRKAELEKMKEEARREAAGEDAPVDSEEPAEDGVVV